MRDHIFSRASSLSRFSQLMAIGTRASASSLLFPDPHAHFVEPEAHDQSHRKDIVRRTEASHRKVALVLNWLIAALRRHILRHFESLLSVERGGQLVGGSSGGPGDTLSCLEVDVGLASDQSFDPSHLPNLAP